MKWDFPLEVSSERPLGESELVDHDLEDLVRRFVRVFLLASCVRHRCPVRPVLTMVYSSVEVSIQSFVQLFPVVPRADIVHVVHTRTSFQDIWKYASILGLMNL